MAKITVGTDCGNSPKRIFLKDFNSAFANGDIEFLSTSITDDIVWHMIGDKTIEGKSAFVEILTEMQSNPITELIIHKIITHGKEGSVNGEMVMADGQRYAFADVYEFANAKGSAIKSIESYVIELK